MAGGLAGPTWSVGSSKRFSLKSNRLRMPAAARLREAEPLAAKAIDKAAGAAVILNDDSSATR